MKTYSVPCKETNKREEVDVTSFSLDISFYKNAKVEKVITHNCSGEIIKSEDTLYYGKTEKDNRIEIYYDSYLKGIVCKRSDYNDTLRIRLIYADTITAEDFAEVYPKGYKTKKMDTNMVLVIGDIIQLDIDESKLHILDIMEVQKDYRETDFRSGKSKFVVPVEEIEKPKTFYSDYLNDFRK
jgi:hypothetical protein